MTHEILVSKDDEGNTALHYLVLNMKEIDTPDLNNMVTTLLKCGIDINAQNKKGETALHICTKYEFLGYRRSTEETFSGRLSSFYLYVA
jgi:ankyrin repeat protein